MQPFFIEGSRVFQVCTGKSDPMIIRMRMNSIQLTLALLGNTESSPIELYDFDKSQPGVIVVISDHQENLGRF